MVLSFLANGKMMSKLEMGKKNGPMVHILKEFIKMDRKTDLEHFNGQMAANIQEN